MGNARILVIDDDPQILALAMGMLQGEGYDVQGKTSGRHAAELTRTLCIDLVVLDLNMPEPDGFEVMKELQENCPGCRILMVSGKHGAVLKSAWMLGADSILQKPYSSADLSREVRSLLVRG